MKNKKDTIILIFVGIIVSIMTFLGIRFLLNKSNDTENVPKVDEKNYFILKENDKEGVIDKEGKRIVEPKYNKIVIPNYSYPLFFAYENNNQKILDDKSEFKFTKKGLFNKKAVLRTVFPIEESNGEYNIVRPNIKYKENGKFGLMSLNGIELTKAIYEEIRPIVEDNDCYLVKANGKEGILNEKGEEILKPEYESIYSMNLINTENNKKSIGYGFSKKNESGKDLNGYVTLNGNMLVDAKYENIIKMQIDSNDHYLIVENNKKQGVFRNQDKILDVNYDEIIYNHNYIVTKLNDKYDLYNLNGKKINKKELNQITLKKSYAIGKENDEYIIFSDDYNEILRTKKIPEDAFGYEDKKYVVINEEKGLSINQINNGKMENIAGENKIYQNIQYLFDDIILCQNGHKYRAFKLNEKKQLENTYTFISVFGNTKILIGNKSDGKSDFFDSNLDKIEGLDLKTIIYIKEKDKNGIVVEANNEIISINEDGKKAKVQEMIDRKIYPFKEKNKYGYKDKEGKIVVKPIYDRADQVNIYGFASIQENGKWGVISQSGEIIVKPKIEEKSIADIYGEYAPIVISNYIVSSNSTNDVYNLNNLPSLDRFKEKNEEK